MHLPLPLKTQIRYPILRLLTLIIVCGIMFVALPALAQEGVGGALEGVVTKITDLIKGLTLVVGALGITLWGFGKVARPIFPEIASLTGQYFNNFIVGVIVVYLAAEIVDQVAAAAGAGG